MTDLSRISGGRRYLILGLIVLGLLCAVLLDLRLSQLRPVSGANGKSLAGEFFSAAFRPALTYEITDSAERALLEQNRPFWRKIVDGLALTLRYAVASVSISVVLGLLLGFLASTSWWPKIADDAGRLPKLGMRALRTGHVAIRTLIAFARSIHELLWALLILTAFGLSPIAAVIAIAIPYTGTFAKIFSEMIDEQPRDTSELIRAIGGSAFHAFWIGLVPRAMPDLVTYAFYRFECALRSSAVLGFLGIESIGMYIKLSFENLHYREVWSYLYALGILLIIVDRWSAAIRKRVA